MQDVPEIPGYRIERKLGEGGMAKVYFGVQEKLKRKVAIKVLEPLLLKDDDFARRFLKEAETAANLIHPNIVTIYDVGQVGQYYYMVMEYLEGTLKDKINEGSRDKQGLWQGDHTVSLDIVKKVAGALEYAHQRGFIHRDIKPDNIMFRHDGTPVLVDFGIAKALDATTRLTRTGMSIGTPHYMSPEQIRGQDIDGRADLYSLGIVFYEMLVGDVPYRASDYIAVAVKHLNEPIPGLPSNLSSFQPLIEKMMAKDKDDRVQSAEKLIRTIESFQAQIQENKKAQVKKTHLEPGVSHAERLKPAVEPVETGATIKGFRRRESAGLSKKGRIIGVAAFVLVVVVVFWVIQFTSNKNSKENGDSDLTVQQKTMNDVDPAQSGQPEGSESGKTEDLQPTSGNSEAPKEAPIGPSGGQEAYESYVQSAREDYRQGNYQSSLGNIEKAREIRKSDQLDVLEGKVQKKIEESQKPRQDPGIPPKTNRFNDSRVTSPPKDKIQTPATVHVRTVNLIDLPRELNIGYNDKMKRIVISDLPPGVKALGPIGFNFSIDEKGCLSIIKMNQLGLKIIPKMSRRRVVKMILDEINKIILAPPKDTNGQPVKVGNWRLFYRVGTFEGKIILTRRSI